MHDSFSVKYDSKMEHTLLTLRQCKFHRALQYSRDNTYSVEIDQVVQMGILVNLETAIAFTDRKVLHFVPINVGLYGDRSEEPLFNLAAFLAHSV